MRPVEGSVFGYSCFDDIFYSDSLPEQEKVEKKTEGEWAKPGLIWNTARIAVVKTTVINAEHFQPVKGVCDNGRQRWIS